MKKLLSEVIRNMILEYTPQKGVTLYHRSFHKFNVGDVIKPGIDPATGKPHRSDKSVEKALESYRAKKHSELPSRFNCVYLSYLPRSRFLSKGYLYAVTIPDSHTLTTNSRIIDKLTERYREEYDFHGKVHQPYVYENDDLIKSYWDGVEPTRTNLKDLEVLAPFATVIEIVDDNRLIRNTDVEFGNILIQSTMHAYVDKHDPTNEYTYASDGNTKVKISDVLNALKNANGVTVGKASSVSYSDDPDDKDYVVTLTSSFKGKVVSIIRPDPGQEGTYSRISLAPDDVDVRLSLDSAASFKFMKAYKKGLIRKL